MKSLLVKDASLTLNHTKWFKKLNEAEIIMKEQVYELAKTNSKRDFIYNNEGIAIDSKSFKLINNFIKIDRIFKICALARENLCAGARKLLLGTRFF